MVIEGIEQENNPLAFVDRLLEKERDSFLHFGDVRFWRHMEYIETPQIYRTKSLEYRTMKLMFFEAAFWVLFLVFLTIYIVHTRPPNVYDARRQQLDYWGDCAYQPGVRSASCKFEDVADTDSFMDWLKVDFIPKAFTDRHEYHSIANSTSIFRLQQGLADWQPRYVGDTKTSILIGNIRIRQLRVQYNKACTINAQYASLHSACFPDFEASIQSRLSWAPTWTPDHLREYFEYQTGNYTEMTEVDGQYGSYPPDGFVIEMPMNITGAMTRVEELKNWNWLDQRTRAIVIEMSVLQPNVNVFVHNRFLFEFPAAGGVLAKHDVFSFRIMQLSLSLMFTDEIWAFVYLLLTFSMHIFFIIYFGFLFFQNGFSLFNYFWSWIDLSIVFVFSICCIASLRIWWNASLIPNLQPQTIGDPELFLPIGHLVPQIELSNCLISVLGLLSWLKILKYFALIGGTGSQAFVRIIERSLYNLCLFGGLLVVVLTGFACAFYIGFGGERDLFSTLLGSFIACIVAPAGGISLEPIFSKGGALGPLLVIGYFIIVTLLLCNTFLAICADTYSVCMYELATVKSVSKSSPTRVFLWTYFNALRGVKLVGKETEEDKGQGDEQQIALTSLPEAIAGRYLETKKKMEGILDNALQDIERQRQEKLRQQGLEESKFGKALATVKHAAHLDATHQNPAAYQNMIEDKQRTPEESEYGESLHDDNQKSAEEQVMEDLASVTVRRVQLQRMLDDDEILRQICATNRAIDVMRRFRVDQSGIDPYEAVMQLQAKVTKLLEDIELRGVKLSFNEVETLRTVSQELHVALTESQKEWRAELLSVLQMATLLSKALVYLTKKIEAVQMNHKDLAQRVGPPK
jgi:hypothetical protein